MDSQYTTELEFYSKLTTATGCCGDAIRFMEDHGIEREHYSIVVHVSPLGRPNDDTVEATNGKVWLCEITPHENNTMVRCSLYICEDKLNQTLLNLATSADAMVSVDWEGYHDEWSDTSIRT